MGRIHLRPILFSNRLIMTEFLQGTLSSVRTVTPNSCAFVSLEPAASPAITKSVFAETEPLDFRAHVL